MTSMAVQEAPGQYNDDVWEALDRVLDEARRAGLKVMLSFLDNWKYIGELLPCSHSPLGICHSITEDSLPAALHCPP